MRKRVLGLIIALAVGAGGFAIADKSSDDPHFRSEAGNFEGRFLAVSDASMAATAYANGLLEPFDGMQDQLTLFERGAVKAVAEASNSVVSWPTILETSADGQFAFVGETFGNLDRTVQSVESAYSGFPPGASLNVFAISNTGLTPVASLNGFGEKIQSVDFVSAMNWIVVSSEAERAELAIARLDGAGVITPPKTFSITPPYSDADTEKRIRSAMISPDGKQLAVNVANARIQFYNIETGVDGLPTSIQKNGDAIEVDGRLATSRWSPNGKFLLVADLRRTGGTVRMLTLPHGWVHVIAPPAGTQSARIVSSGKAGIFPEGFEISDDGKRVAAIAMDRTYLPDLPFLEVWPRRRQYTLTLFDLDPASGEIAVLDEIRAAGVLPEDVIFDAAGRNLAVAVFHRRKGEARQSGFVDFYTITADAKLVAQGKTQKVMRGVHDLVRLP
jgi:hypothetical protein